MLYSKSTELHWIFQNIKDINIKKKYEIEEV